MEDNNKGVESCVSWEVFALLGRWRWVEGCGWRKRPAGGVWWINVGLGWFGERRKRPASSRRRTWEKHGVLYRFLVEHFGIGGKICNILFIVVGRV